MQEWPWVAGCDMAGTVAEAPEGSPWKAGDKVWSFTAIGEKGCGTLAEYVQVCMPAMHCICAYVAPILSDVVWQDTAHRAPA